MRRILLGAVLAALLALLVAAPAGAMPPNEVLIAKNLTRLGLIPRYANSVMAESYVKNLVGAGPSYEAKSSLVARTTQGKRTALGKFLTTSLVDDPSATQTYTSHTLVLLVEFGDQTWPDGEETGHVTSGPVHGNIAAPASDDNSTYWPGDFTRMHYQQQLFGNSFGIYDQNGRLRGTSDNTMRNYYLEQSHGTYTVDGDIANWVKLDLPESYYGADSDPWVSTDDLTGPVWRVARDAVAKFAEENPDFDWSEYDQENPYGIAGSDFNVPDGYVDHLILIHAGSDESAGGGTEGSDSIWAHSWGIYENLNGGPGDGPGMQIPGTATATNPKGIWVYNYTINPEDGDVGVFCHEFGHDLGLPDEYDYSSVTGDATSGFWTIMASGSWLGRQWGLGTQPCDMNVWDKTALGFVTPKTVKRGTTKTVKLQPSTEGSAAATGVKIELPKRKHVIQLSGKDGALEWYSGMGNSLDNTLVTNSKVTVSASDPTLTLRTWYDIEEGYDWGFVAVSENGQDWTTVQSAGHTTEYDGGVYGLTGTDTDHWADTISFDLSAFAGKRVYVLFEYMTDSGVANLGWEVTDVKLGGTALPASAFTADGWTRVDGSQTKMSEQYYIAEYRTYDGFDASLKDCYQFNNEYASWVDWFSYNKGLHLIYRDTFYIDNDVATHGSNGGGYGGWQVVDARPKPDGVSYGTDSYGYWRPRIQVRDASFSLKPTKSQSIYLKDYDADVNVGERIAPGKLAQPWFNDAWTYWYQQTPEAGTIIPKNLGVRIQVKSMNADGMTIWVDNVK